MLVTLLARVLLLLKHIMEEFANSSSFTKKVSLLERRTILPVLWNLKQTVHG